MAPGLIKTNELMKTEYSEKTAIGALYDELSKNESIKKAMFIRLMKLGRKLIRYNAYG